MFKKAIELSNNEVANITFKAYNPIIKFIDEPIGINNVMGIDIYIKILRNDGLTFSKNIDRAFQVVECELSKALEKS
jgi:hypothetical protein